MNEKIVWDSGNVNNFQQLLLENENIFETISLQTMTGEMTIDDSINKFSNLLHYLSKTVFGKPFQHYHCEKGSIKNPWFNQDCKNARADFFSKKKQYKTSKSNSDKISFLKVRNHYAYIRRKAKLVYQTRQGKWLSDLSKSNSRAFWKSVKRLNNGSATDIPLSNISC